MEISKKEMAQRFKEIKSTKESRRLLPLLVNSLPNPIKSSTFKMMMM